MVVPSLQLVSTEHGLVPEGQGWFVVNACETQWWERKGRGVLCEFEGAGFEGAADFLQLGINLTVLSPGEPMAMYHRETDQEDFLVLAGEALAIVEGQERPLRQWDFVHCPPGTNHVIVGAGARRASYSQWAPATTRKGPMGRVHGERSRTTPRRGRRTGNDRPERGVRPIPREQTDPLSRGLALRRLGGVLPQDVLCALHLPPPCPVL